MITLLNRFDDQYVVKKEDVLEIAAKYVKDHGEEAYLRDINFTKEDGVITDFNYKNNEFSINMDNLLKRSKELYQQLKEKYKSEDKYESYYLNFYILQAIYQELTHVSQKKKIESSNKQEELYRYLIELSIKEKENNQKLFRGSPLLIPAEIEATNTGLLTAFNLLDYTKLPSKESNIMYLEYLKNLILYYQRMNKYQVKTPIEILKEKDNNIDLKKIYRLLDKSKMKKMARMNLGLPITASEYKGIEKAIKNHSK